MRFGILNSGSIQHHQLEVARGFVNLHHAGAAQTRDLEIAPSDAMGCYAALKNLLVRLR
jgi:hypothetical protein